LTRIWARKGTRPRALCDTRYEWAYIFGAICPDWYDTGFGRIATCGLIENKDAVNAWEVGQAGPGLLAHVMVANLSDHLPPLSPSRDLRPRRRLPRLGNARPLGWQNGMVG
jgi:hypothetical protein